MEGVSHRAGHQMLANSLAHVLGRQWAQGQGFSVPPPVHESAIQQAIRLGNCSMARPGPCFNAEESRRGLARTCGTTGAQQSGSAIQLWRYHRWNRAFRQPCWTQLNEIRSAVIDELKEMIYDWGRRDLSVVRGVAKSSRSTTGPNR